MLQAICISQLNMNESAEELSKRDMFNRIVSNGGVVKSQQINEKDLTITEKLTILQADFEANNELFLYKFGIYLNINDLKNFDLENESDSHYYLDKLKQSLDPTKIETRVKNRRYNYLQRILKKSSYFSDEEMKIRSPFIYQQYIEQYKTHEERLAEKENDLSQNTLSQFLLGTIDNKVYQARCKIEEEAAEVEEEDEDDEDDNELDDDKLIEEDSDFKKYLSEDKSKIPEDEKERLRVEFLSLMEERFLSGEDCEFDYKNVDYNEEYDDIYDQDMEDSYFDED